MGGDKKKKRSSSSRSSSSSRIKRKHKKDKKKSNKSIERKQKQKQQNPPSEAIQGAPPESKQQRIAKIKEDRRKRSRSNSAVRHYKKLIMANNPAAKANSLSYDKQDQFWDGFAWVPKTNLHDKVRDDKDKVMSQTSRMRRVQICNIPTGLTNRDLFAELSRYMNRNFLNDMGNAKPILQCNLNEKDRTCTLELSSVEEANRLLKLESIQLLDENCKILRLGDSLYGINFKNNFFFQIEIGQSINQSQLVQQAHNWAQAQAAALLALRSLGMSKGQRPEDEILAQAGISSRIIKVGNFLNSAMAINLSRKEWNDMREDLLDGFSSYGLIEDDFFVKPYQAGLGAEAGCIFIVYATKEEAQKAVVEMFGRTYNAKELKIIFINEQTYIRSYIPLKTKPPPTGYEEVVDSQEEDGEDSSEEQDIHDKKEDEMDIELKQEMTNQAQQNNQSLMKQKDEEEVKVKEEAVKEEVQIKEEYQMKVEVQIKSELRQQVLNEDFLNQPQPEMGVQITDV